ncbi:hypothetical protein AB433_08685 [Croceicoccus naphthovorans]|uniref:Uncharacterized protein n=1 Tax=Croceicoccus naphthovorans TaxID=1348774 RepID=A0A0G3XJF5_9SPHN|nr:hypothetical protein AB433_08685 [Croceicoccus naphthovorans]
MVANGQDITKLLIGSAEQSILVSLRINDEAGLKSDTMELTVDNREPFDIPPIGSLVEVWLGYEPSPVPMGKFRLDHWELSGPPSILTLTAASAELTTEIKGQKTRSWHDTTLGQIASKIAGEHSLGLSIAPDLASREVEHIDQQTESDLNFLSRLAKRNGAVFKLADGKILLAEKGSDLHPSGTQKLETKITPSDVVSWRIEESERGQNGSVKCQWVDHEAGKRKTVTAGSGSPVQRDKRLYRTEAEAGAAARALLGDLQRGKRSGSIEMAGNPALYAGCILGLSGFHAAVDGQQSVSSVTHELRSSGYTTSASFESV